MTDSQLRLPLRASRALLRPFAAALLLAGLLPAFPAHAFDFYEVARRAKALAAEKYKPPVSQLPKELRELPFASYQQIQLKRERYHWADGQLSFLLNFHHQGMAFDQAVTINEVDAEGVRPVPYRPADFDFGPHRLDPKQASRLGFAGFRILYPLNTPGKRDDELATFLGASYFRFIGKGQVYGISARGLAIDTGMASGEEFPRFREFWIARPANQDKHIVVHALLDSPRATGAYRFTITPGDDTVVQVRSRIYLRAPVGKLGIAPLTSMYLYGANQPATTPNYRPQIHDSDGLAFHAGNGEWVWRPLNNPRKLAQSAFTVENPRGFGLMQRGRDFSRYEDLDDHYELRPTLWIEPEGNWGKGRVELIEIPTADETNDNIVAFWVPDTQPKPGTALDVDYTMRWTRHEAAIEGRELARVLQTRRAPGENKGPDLIRRPDGSLAFLVDFSAPGAHGGTAVPVATPARGAAPRRAAARKPELAPMPVSLNFSANGNADVIESSLRPNPATGGWRATLRIRVKDATKPVEMRASLANGPTQVSETWSYQVPANDVAQ